MWQCKKICCYYSWDCTFGRTWCLLFCWSNAEVRLATAQIVSPPEHSRDLYTLQYILKRVYSPLLALGVFLNIGPRPDPVILWYHLYGTCLAHVFFSTSLLGCGDASPRISMSLLDLLLHHGCFICSNGMLCSDDVMHTEGRNIAWSFL